MSVADLTNVERDLLGQVSRERLWRHTERLGSSYRASGSPEERAAVQYVVDELRDAGIEDVKVYELEAYLSYHKSASCTVISPEPGEIACVTQSYTRPTPPEGLELEVVVAGEYTGDYSDKAVLTARGWPTDGVDQARLQIHAQMTEEPNLHRGGGTGVWGMATPDRAHRLSLKTPAITISRPDGEALRDLVRQGSVRVQVTTEVETDWKTISFPVATIPGQEDTFVLTGGHLDSHDPGATDNATGCACLLELARLFNERRSELHHGIRIGWWTGHESAGYAGSTWFCDNEWEDLHQRCVLYWNNDGPGIRGTSNIEGRYIFPQAEQFVLSLIRDYFDREPDIMAKPLKMGDQSFWGVGVPSASVYRCLAPEHEDWAVVFGAGHGRWWHSTEDTLDKVDPDILVDDTKFYALALYRLCTANVLPFEFVTYARWMQDQLGDLQRSFGDSFDLSSLQSRVAEFLTLAEALNERRNEAKDGKGQARINGCMMRLSRYLDPVFFTVEGLYGQDLRGAIPGPYPRYPLPSEPAFQPGYFPGLRRASKVASLDRSSGEYWQHYTLALRERNRASHGLAQAIDDVRRTLATLDTQ
jgi:hypothetical protein